MLHQVLRKAAAGHEVSCPAENELHIHKDGRIYRFSCGNCEIRFEVYGRPEVVFLASPDANVHEMKRFLSELIDSPENHELQTDACSARDNLRPCAGLQQPA